MKNQKIKFRKPKRQIGEETKLNLASSEVIFIPQGLEPKWLKFDK